MRQRYIKSLNTKYPLRPILTVLFVKFFILDAGNASYSNQFCKFVDIHILEQSDE